MTYEYLTAAIKPKYNLKESQDWISDRLLIANVVIKEPSVLNHESSDTQVNPDVAIDVFNFILYVYLYITGCFVTPKSSTRVTTGQGFSTLIYHNDNRNGYLKYTLLWLKLHFRSCTFYQAKWFLLSDLRSLCLMVQCRWRFSKNQKNFILRLSNL